MTYGGMNFTCASGQRFFRFVLLCLLLRSVMPGYVTVLHVQGDTQFVGYKKKEWQKLKLWGTY